MKLHKILVEFSTGHPVLTMALAGVLFIAMVTQIPHVKVDTDPENMLPEDQPSRVFHNEVKRDFDLHDLIVVGVVNETHPEGVFNPASLSRIHDLTRAIESIEGVIRRDLMSLASVDDIGQDGPGVVRFEWLMKTPPADDEAALLVRDRARRIPAIDGTLVSEDGRAAAIYVPVRKKSESHRIATEIEAIIEGFDGDDRFFITGLPVAEDTFGVEMFKQMGMAAPLAGLIIFVLMFVFFRSIALITAPMIVAIVTVAVTMGLLIGMGFTLHIMSSMIPIFLMPIAVVDSIHILSEFADMYPRIGDRKKTIRLVMNNLLRPMHYTSLTSAAGFASLALAPIPPVRVFGIFVAIGITLAFYLTITFIPAWVVRLGDERIARMSRGNEDGSNLLSRLLARMGPRVIQRSRLFIVATVGVMALSAWGISRIEINDNPIRWFRPDHSIRVADRVLNEHFAGTYDAFLVLEKQPADDPHELRETISAVLTRAGGSALAQTWLEAHDAAIADPHDRHLDALIDAIDVELDEADAEYVDAWDEALAHVEDAQLAYRYFQTPEALAYIQDLQVALAQSGFVGKSNSIVDIVRTVHRELYEGSDDYFTIPGSAPGVAQTLLSYQSSHRPYDLWHFVTPDFRAANIWLQLKSGDNKDMIRVTEYVDKYVASHPLPRGVSLDWAGLTYLNVVWQEAMVGGMANALLGSFVIVFLMMVVLFRSLWFGLLAMLPLTITIGFVYGVIGIAGKDYDMPVAVLSSLTLGLSVDFAIHFLQRIRVVHDKTRDWPQTIRVMFAEPAHAITRNAIVIAVGFLPLLASPLMPYNTVGIFLAAIMIVSSVVTLVLLPSVLEHVRSHLLRSPGDPKLSSEARPHPVVPTVFIAFMAGMIMHAPPATAGDLTRVEEIINQANRAAYYAADDGRSLVRMTITDAQGRERRRQFTILRKDREDGGDQDYVVLFVRPADVRGTVFLVKKHVGSADDRWFYLPDLDLVRRIAAGDKRTSFVGSHFFYEDVSGRGVDEDIHTLESTTEEHYVVRSTPRDPGSVEFAYFTAWIDKATLISVKMEYTDESGEVYRRIEALEIQEIGGYPSVTKMKATDLGSGGFTVTMFRKIEYNIGIPDEVFTERSLRNPSPEWFRGK